MKDVREFSFRQVDVFSDVPVGGNPVAVVHDADGLDGDTMARFARWTNLSETTFLLSPTAPNADWRLRIFTPMGELPFAGHPTLGSAHAWLEAGGTPKDPDRLVQECQSGLIELRRIDGRLGFAAPPLDRFGSVEASDLNAVAKALRITPEKIVDSSWVDNGPGWIGLLLDTPQAVLELRPDFANLPFNTGVIALYPNPGEVGADAEVRAFCMPGDPPEDPVTGSLNAGFAQWLVGTILPDKYVVSQGTVLGCAGRVHVSKDEAGDCWVSGNTKTVIEGVAYL